MAVVHAEQVHAEGACGGVRAREFVQQGGGHQDVAGEEGRVGATRGTAYSQGKGKGWLGGGDGGACPTIGCAGRDDAQPDSDIGDGDE